VRAVGPVVVRAAGAVVVPVEAAGEEVAAPAGDLVEEAQGVGQELLQATVVRRAVREDSLERRWPRPGPRRGQTVWRQARQRGVSPRGKEW
jgi:hypothetical protein